MMGKVWEFCYRKPVGTLNKSSSTSSMINENVGFYII